MSAFAHAVGSRGFYCVGKIARAPSQPATTRQAILPTLHPLARAARLH